MGEGFVDSTGVLKRDGMTQGREGNEHRDTMVHRRDSKTGFCVLEAFSYSLLRGTAAARLERGGR